jgi:hypothetical protein
VAESKLWVLYHIKKQSRDGKEKTYFDRVGRGFENKDGSFNVWLETLPVGLNGETTFNLQPYRPKEKKEADGFSE